MNNKLIEKLAVQSLVYVDTGLDDGKELIFSKEKFAESIVRECANIAFDEYAATNGADSGESAILKHFGVEE